MAQISNKFAIYITIGRLISMIAGFLMPVILVRIMSKDDYGLTSQFLTLYTSLSTIVVWGIHSNIFFFCPSADKETASKYITNTLFLLLLLGIITGSILYLPFIQNLIFGQSELGKYSNLIILSIALAAVTTMVSPMNTVCQDKWGALIYPGVVAFLRIVTIFFSIYIYDNIHEMFFWLFIYQCAISLSVILYVRLKTRFVLDFKLVKSQLAYSLPFGLSVAFQLLSNYFDKFVCIQLLTPADYAIYAIAFLSIPGVNLIYESLCQVNIVNMSNSYRTGHTEEICPQYSTFVVKTLSFSTPIILIVSLYAEEIMCFLYTESYISSASYFRLYSLTFLTSMLGAGTILRSMGQTKLSLWTYIITCIIGLPVTYFAVKHFGTIGAISGAMFNMMFPRILQLYFEVHTLKCKISDFIQWRKIYYIGLYSIVLLIPFIIIKYSLHLNIYWCIVESCAYITSVYLLLIHKDIFIIDKHNINKLYKKLSPNINNPK